MYGLGFALLIGILVLTDSYLTVDDLEEPDYDYVTDTVIDDDKDVPVVSTDTIIAKPYSDEKIRKLLEEKDIYISRRTVTKYREECFIYNSRQRKIEKILWEEK